LKNRRREEKFVQKKANQQVSEPANPRVNETLTSKKKKTTIPNQAIKPIKQQIIKQGKNTNKPPNSISTRAEMKMPVSFS
jgi:hypothetical protein